MHDVGTGSGAVALALERRAAGPGGERFRCVGGRRGGGAAQRGALGLDVESALRGLPPGEYRPRRGEPALRARGRVGGARARDQAATSRARRSCPARTGSTRSARWSQAPARDAAGARARARSGGRGAALLSDGGDAAATSPDDRARHRRPGAVTPEDVATFERCIAVGGVALFPADTVYGLATEPESAEGVRRLYALKGRRADRPAAVMFFQLELALAALPELAERTRAALERLLPGGGHAAAAEPGAALPAGLRGHARALGAAGAQPWPARSRPWPQSAGRSCSPAPTGPASPRRAASRTSTRP